MVEQPRGIYRELPVAPALAGHFHCAWTHQMPSAATAPLIIIPDAHVDLIWRNGEIGVAGPDRVYHPETPPAGATLVGFRLRSGHAAAWLGVPLAKIADQRLSLADVWGCRRARRLTEALGESRDPEVVLHRLSEALARHTGAVAGPAPAMAAAYELLAAETHPDEAPVRRLTTELGLSERTLRRHFDEAFGYGPKTLDRILRFQRFLRLVQTQRDQTISRLAAAAGYADQAHLTRESRRLAAATPVELVRSHGA